MITFKQYLTERMERGTSLSTLLFMPKITEYDRLMIPISSSMYKRIWPDTLRATVFHTTDVKGVKNIAKLQGKKKQISAFFAMQSRYMEIGVATQGGVHAVVEMDADVLLSAKGDIMSHIDKVGRRWTTIADLKETSRRLNFSKVEKDLEKMFSKLVNKYLTRGEFQDNMTDFQLWHTADRFKHGSQVMRKLIKEYIDGMEKVIKKNIDTFSDAMLSYAKKRDTDYSWDEQVVNNFKVKKVHLFRINKKAPSLIPEQDELIKYIDSQNWPYTRWDSALELEIYTRDLAQKELGK